MLSPRHAPRLELVHGGASADSVDQGQGVGNGQGLGHWYDNPSNRNGLHRWVHRNAPRAAASAFEWALRDARVPPVDYRHKPPSEGSILGAD